MKTLKIGARGILFTFEDPYETNVFVICSENYSFICDTFLGSEAMDKVTLHLKENGSSSKPIIVFNSHADYDHYWGNGSFKKSLIIGHELCRRRIEEESEKDLKEFSEHKRGEVEITPPNIVFKEKIEFVEEGVEFYHTPGHTPDSSSCFDRIDKTLFVSDNIGLLPYIHNLKIPTYAATLSKYLTRDARTVVTGHDGISTGTSLIKGNLEYLKEFRKLSNGFLEYSKKEKIIHFFNLASIGERLKEKSKLKEALEYFEKSKLILDQLEDATVGKAEQVKRIQEIIASLQRQI